MKLVILSLSGPFTVGMLYKENWFVRAAIEAGDSVTVISGEERYRNGKLVRGRAGVFHCQGYTLIRMKKRRIFSRFVSDKLRYYCGLEKKIIGLSPDTVFVNGPQFWNIKNFRKIKRALPECKIVWGFSVWRGNSGRNPLSINILHRFIYRLWLKKGVPYADKLFYTSEETRAFIKEVYQLPMEKAELNDLPGEVIDKAYKEKIQKDFKIRHSLPDDTVVFVHSGKMDKEKRTEELLREFSRVKDERFRLYVIGSLSDDIKDSVEQLIRGDSRIRYVGFVGGAELSVYLAAASVYLQPGSVSQTFQNAICSGCAVVAADLPNNRKLVCGNGRLISSTDLLADVFEDISNAPQMLEKMTDASLRIAKEKLDYRELYSQIYK